ncbi:hypothetical protein J6590_029393 [Homalodisca vitripennis]|nr:hypothetical protein J6590_029393 [Homalodisca vitripennis]
MAGDESLSAPILSALSLFQYRGNRFDGGHRYFVNVALPPFSSMGRPTAMHLSLKGLLRTPEARHEAYQSVVSSVPQSAENNLSGPPGEIPYPCPNYQRWHTAPLLLKGNQRASARQFHPAHHTFYRGDQV